MSHNPFLDLGALPEEAALLHIRSQLAAVLERHIDRKGWSRADASRLLRMSQPAISKVVNRDIKELSIEVLIALLSRVGLSVGISVSRASPASDTGRRLMTKLTGRQLVGRDSKRDLGAELLQAVRDMKADRGTVVFTTSSKQKTPQRRVRARPSHRRHR
jgi:predicted XRE-type DNA-binding protein